MSAFIANDITTAAVAAYAVKTSESDNLDTVLSACQVLREQNQRSVNCRYKTNNEPDPVVITQENLDGILRINPVRILGAIECYAYQACETSDWAETKAHRIFQEALGEARRLSQAPNGEGWGLTEDDIPEP